MGSLLLGVLMLILGAMTSIGGAACESGGAVLSDKSIITVLLDNSSITTVTEPSGYIQVEVRPAEIVVETEQQVYVECTALPLIECPVTIVSVELALFDSEDVLLRKQLLDTDAQRGGSLRHTIYRIVGDEDSYKLFVVFDIGRTLDDPGERYSEYTVASMPITITE